MESSSCARWRCSSNTFFAFAFRADIPAAPAAWTDFWGSPSGYHPSWQKHRPAAAGRLRGWNRASGSWRQTDCKRCPNPLPWGWRSRCPRPQRQRAVRFSFISALPSLSTSLNRPSTIKGPLGVAVMVTVFSSFSMLLFFRFHISDRTSPHGNSLLIPYLLYGFTYLCTLI